MANGPQSAEEGDEERERARLARDILVHNEQVKLTANLMNIGAAGFAITGIVAPLTAAMRRAASLRCLRPHADGRLVRTLRWSTLRCEADVDDPAMMSLTTYALVLVPCLVGGGDARVGLALPVGRPA